MDYKAAKSGFIMLGRSIVSSGSIGQQSGSPGQQGSRHTRSSFSGPHPLPDRTTSLNLVCTPSEPQVWVHGPHSPHCLKVHVSGQGGRRHFFFLSNFRLLQGTPFPVAGRSTVRNFCLKPLPQVAVHCTDQGDQDVNSQSLEMTALVLDDRAGLLVG